MKAPYFPFYPKDWLLDSKVKRLSREQRSFYFDLLCRMWIESEDTTLPSDDITICTLLDIRPSKWKKLKAVFFDKENGVLQEENGKIFNKRLKKESEIFKNKSETNSENANKRWKDKKKSVDNPSKLLKNLEDENATASFSHMRNYTEPHEIGICEKDAISESDTDTDTDSSSREGSSTPEVSTRAELEEALSSTLENFDFQRATNPKVFPMVTKLVKAGVTPEDIHETVRVVNNRPENKNKTLSVLYYEKPILQCVEARQEGKNYEEQQNRPKYGKLSEEELNQAAIQRLKKRHGIVDTEQ